MPQSRLGRPGGEMLQSPQGPNTGDLDAARAAWDALVVRGLLGERGLVRVSRDGGASYPLRYQQPIGAHPCEPAACFVYDGEGMGRMLVADFDTKHHPPSQAADDAAGFRQLIRRCGGEAIEDLSPTGGRHVYVPFAARLPFALLKRVTEALHVRLSSPLWHGTFDKSPMMNATDGLIRLPGSPHPAGGYQALVPPHAEAVRIATRGNDSRVWDALLTELAPELDVVTGSTFKTPDRLPTAANAPRHDLPPDYEVMARTGCFDPARYPSRSEGRLAVLRAARWCGWTDLDQVITRALPAGPWAGLGAMFAKYQAPVTRRRQWERDWNKAATPLPAKPTGAALARNRRRSFPTRQEDTPPYPLPPAWTPIMPGEARLGGQSTVRAAWIREWGFIRCALQAVHLAEACGRWDGRVGLSARLVLRAAARAAMLRADRRIAFGTRFLGLGSLLDRTTVGNALRRLREEPDPFLVLVNPGSGVHGDLYEWRIPDQFADAARFTNPLAGRIEALHPVFRDLGVPAALVYDALDATQATPGELARATRLSVSSQRSALRVLAQVGLAQRGAHGWHRGPADPDALARALGADETHQQIAARWAIERAAWQTLCAARRPAADPDAPAAAEHELRGDGAPQRHASEHEEFPARYRERPAAHPASTPLSPTPAAATGAAARNKNAFDTLPHLQRAVLAELFRADQAAEREEKARQAAGEPSREAAQWRTLDITDTRTTLTANLARLAPRANTEAAIDALEHAGLIETHQDQALFGSRTTVRLRRRARALARAGLGIPPPPKRLPGLLSRGLWRCLVQIARAEPNGLPHHRLWEQAPLHLAEGTFYRPGKCLITLSTDGRWHLTPLGDEHVYTYLEVYLRGYGIR